MAVDLALLRNRNLERWKAAKLTRAGEFRPVAARLVAAKLRYQAVEAQTGVPWYFIAVTHQRESSQRWDRSLAQGDPWNRVSVHVPRGRGPFASWEEAAIDALVNCAPYVARNTDWGVGTLLTELEKYNGIGYFSGPKDKETGARYPSQPSPYIWSGTDQYQSGKYVRDGVYKPNVVDSQLGCAGLLLAMQALDPSIKLEGKMVTLPPPPKVDGKTGTAGGIAAGGAVAAQQAHEAGARPITIALIVAAVIVVAIVAYVLVKRSSERPAPREPEHETEATND